MRHDWQPTTRFLYRLPESKIEEEEEDDEGDDEAEEEDDEERGLLGSNNGDDDDDDDMDVLDVLVGCLCWLIILIDFAVKW